MEDKKSTVTARMHRHAISIKHNISYHLCSAKLRNECLSNHWQSDKICRAHPGQRRQHLRPRMRKTQAWV